MLKEPHQTTGTTFETDHSGTLMNFTMHCLKFAYDKKKKTRQTMAV